MFRDFKEYQEITKLYTEKVSKTKDLDENRNTRGQALRMQREKNKPKTREELGLPDKKKVSPFERKFGKKRNDQRLQQSGLKKKLPTTAEIRAKSKTGMSNIPSKEGNAVIGGKKLNPDFGKKVDIKKEFPDKKPEVSTMTKQGKPRTKAQMMAAKRIAAGKSIDDVKAANTASMKAKAAERFKAFKARRLEKKLDKQRDFDDPDKKMNRGESYTPYDIVLEYLLSTEQAATIEEANYIMTEMDAETIQSIVAE